ncbi:MAG TPA: hypothetical protein VF030_07735 [Solirubrobacterales bacterium]
MSPRNTYRLYTFDGVRMVLDADLIEAESDEEALAKATAAASGRKAELWQDRRLVAALGNESAPPADEWGLPGTLSPSF